MELFFEVTNQKMERMDVEDPVNSSQEYLKLSFDFKTDDWEDTTKFVFFRVHHINYSYPLTDDSILVPAVFLNSKHLDFGVYGVGGEDYRITTNSLRIKFRESKFWSLSDAPLSVTELIDKLFDEKADLTYVDIELADKVDKVDGKELSSNDFTDEYLNLIETHQENINDLSVNKVDKVTGKELSSNDFTDHYKNFLDGFDGDIEAFLLEHKEEIEALITSEVLAAKADKSYVDSELSERDAEINLKSNKSYVDGELDKKANITYVNSELNERDTQINLKSDKTYVDTELNKKSDKTYVDNELNKKANTAHTHTESDITDLQDYALNSDVYSKSEVDELIHNLQNNIKVNGTSGIIQSDESVELYAYTKADGMPVINKKVHFYQITDDEPADEETITSNE
ncbi:MAG: hypothetical protein IKF11_04545 [Methanobrevibacter sp.]|nr:hypothetical protein [Methanobrevibacter sp.]